MAAALPFTPMLIGAGVGAMVDKGTLYGGAMLGAVGGGVAGPLAGAIGGVGTGAAMAPTLAAAPSTMASTAAAGGLPSMASATSAMPGAMNMPGLMAGGAPFGANAASLAGAYNAMPAMDRVMGLGKSMISGLGPKDIAGIGMKTAGLLNQPTQAQPMAAAPPPPPRPAAPPMQPLAQLRSMSNRQQRPSGIINPFSR